jgi:hypothetical protein
MENQALGKTSDHRKAGSTSTDITQEKTPSIDQNDSFKEKIIDKSDVENEKKPIGNDRSDGTNEWSVSWP